MREGVIWITGLSGSGKTTVAKLLAATVQVHGIRPVLIDGDRMRAAIPWKLGYSESDRRQLALFYSQLSQEMAEQGHLVICSTVSLFKDIHKRNRKTITNYFEVWLRVPIEELRRRDTKSIYNSQGAAHASPVVGEHFIAEFPEEPDLVVDNWGPVLPRDVCDRITLAVGFPSVHLEQVLVQ